MNWKNLAKKSWNSVYVCVRKVCAMLFNTYKAQRDVIYHFIYSLESDYATPRLEFFGLIPLSQLVPDRKDDNSCEICE